MASDTPDNLSRRMSQSNRFMLRIQGPKQEVLDTIRSIEGVKFAEAQRVREQGTCDFLVESHDEVDIREELFYAMSEKKYPILQMKSMDLTLEDIFLKVTSQQKGGATYVSDLQ